MGDFARHQEAQCFLDSRVIRYVDKPFIADLCACREMIYVCRPAGTLSVPGVYGGLIDKIPFGASMNKGLTWRMGQTHVNRWTDDPVATNSGRADRPVFRDHAHGAAPRPAVVSLDAPREHDICCRIAPRSHQPQEANMAQGFKMGCAALALGCAVAAPAHAQTAPASGSTQGTGVAALSEKLSPTDQQFIQAAGESGATEIAASKLALAKSGDAQVKQFAQRMIADHTKLARNLNAISTRYGITSEPSPDSSVIGSLQNLQGADFNKAYIEAVVDGHRKAVALFTKESESGNNAQLKSAATKALPIIQHHYEMAQQLAKGKS